MICGSSFDKEPAFSSAKSINIPNKYDDSLPFSKEIFTEQEKKNLCEIPEIDSEILFQSNSLSDCNEECDSILVINHSESNNIPLLAFVNDYNFYKDNGSIDDFNEIIKNTKQLKHPPKIQSSSYFNDLIKREVKSPNSLSKQQLFDFIEPNSIENYAINHFRKQNSNRFFGTLSIEELTTFSMKPLSKPLLEKIPITKKSVVLKLSNLILAFIGILNDSETKDNILIHIINILRDDDSLIDEFFMQIIKTMRKSPNKDALLLSWKLFQTVASLFLVKDEEVANVIRWFLIHNIFEEDIISEYANQTFILFYERSTIGRNFGSNIHREDVLNISRSIQKGNEMFKCSLYSQMWNQKSEFPNLPIPMTLYLTVKALIKNGVMMTKHPFPYIGEKSSHPNEAIPKSVNKRIVDDDNDDRNTRHDKKEYHRTNDENSNRNAIKHKKDYKIANNQKVVINTNNENGDENIKQDEIKTKFSTDLHNNKHEENQIHVNEEGRILFKSKRRNENPYQKANMRIIKMWAMKINENHDIINNGKVRDLLGLIFLWMINLLDPIIPKSMSDSFIKLPTNSNDEAYKDFIDNMPLLHRNTLKYLIGFLREIARNKEFTHETHQTIADNFGSVFVKTSFMTIDPFTRQKMYDISPFFLLYCLDNLDVEEVYPLNPEYETQLENKYIY
ncbi:Rho GTPase activating protein 39 [Tritrichomonas musculus]|uniref:Rho GTPase activating protein 39 n=1 Tax=Tritrichomonas musculus TaxID=1915356 RepID=A0ABR2KVL8_9EUKA